MAGKAEKVAAFYEAMSRGDLDEAVEYVHREVEARPALGGVMDIKRSYSGRDGVRLVWETFRLVRTALAAVVGREAQ